MTVTPVLSQSAQDASPPANAARGSSFYTAMRIMPFKERKAMYEIYGFCRAIDDIADDETGLVPEKLSGLGQWRDVIAKLYTKAFPAHLADLAQAITTFGLHKQDFLDVIDGVEMDVKGPIQAPDWETLERYCDRVACAVGRLSVRVFGLEAQDGLALSHHLGMALQLTNILRDIDEDALANRLYLPSELLVDAGVESRDPAAVVVHPALEQVCLTVAARARGHFEQADGIMKRYERKKVRTPRVMSNAYYALHAALMKRGFKPPRRPVRISKAKLGYILARNLLF